MKNYFTNIKKQKMNLETVSKNIVKIIRKNKKKLLQNI